MGTTAHVDLIRLRFVEKDNQVMVEPEDQDKFCLRVEDAIVACRVMQDFKEVFQNQLNHLKNVLGEWVRSHKDRIHKGLLTLQDARMLFVVVAKGRSYDADLEAELTTLDLKIAKDPQCSRIALDVQALPYCDEESYLSFCNPEWVLEYEKPDAK